MAALVSRRTIAGIARPVRAFQTRHMHQSSIGSHPSILSKPSHSTSRSQSLSETGSHAGIYSSRPPVHRMKKFTPMQLTCNFQTTPSKANSPALLVMPQMAEPQVEDISNIPYINLTSTKGSRVLISTAHGDTTHITSPSGIAHAVDSA
ncbi:hypothetical protein TWF696_009884 [Orbilia brochopaga]